MNSWKIDTAPVLQRSVECSGFEVLTAVICEPFSVLGYEAVQFSASQWTLTRIF
jgi:hypothetical protein